MGLRYKVGMIWSDLGSGKTQGKNPDFWAREGAPRREAVSGQSKFSDLLGAAALGQFQDMGFCNFEPLLRGFGGCLRCIVLGIWGFRECGIGSGK